MRCLACNAIMNEVDLSRVNPVTYHYEDLCGACLRAIKESEIPFSIRYEDDEGCIGAGLWLESLLHSDVCVFEHDYKINDEKT